MNNTIPLSRYVFPDVKELKLLLVGDVHWGSSDCIESEFLACLDYIKNSDCQVIFMGDMLENSSKHSVAGGWANQRVNPDTQMDEMIEMLTPIKHKVLGYHTGNHEVRTSNESGIDISKRICRELQIPYYGWSRMTRIRVGSENYFLYTTHGSSGATLPHTKIRKCLDFARNYGADIYAMGHVHSLDHHVEKFFMPDTKQKTCVDREKHFILTGHFLQYKESYAEHKNMVPSSTGYPKIKLLGEKFGIYVSF